MSKRPLFKSFVNAFKGIVTVFKEERNFRIQVFATVLVIFLMFLFSLSIVEKTILILLIAIILVLELFNSILERLVDVFKPRVHTYIKDIKNIAAGAVLISALGAIFVALIIFCPHIKELILNLF